jgi:hypothetical protein
MKCKNCQFKDSPTVCIGEFHQRLCVLKEEKPEYLEIIRAKSMNEEINQNKLTAHIVPAIPTPYIPKEYPSIKEQVQNFGSAIATTVKQAVKGEAITVSEEEKNRRLAICKTCEWFDLEVEGCKKCGCNMNWKTRLAGHHCPLDPPKW